VRLKLTLKYGGTENIPANYNYFLSSAIYNLLGFGKKEFAQFLHDKGFDVRGKTYKLFTFALRFEKYQIQNDSIKLESPRVTLFVSSPLLNDFLGGIVLGSFREKVLNLKIGNELKPFDIEQIEEVPPPKFHEETKFSLMSPLVLSTRKIYKGETSQYYLRFSDDTELINRIFNQNLANKYLAITGKEYNGKGVIFHWDTEYINKALARNKRITKRIAIYANKTPINVIGNMAPFTLKGDTELMKIGYEAGYGEKNSMGFGMAKVTA